MELMKKHKLHILLPIVLVIVAIAAGLLYNGLQGSTSSNQHYELGQQHLNELDYAAAVLEFSNAIALDPTNLDARVGLAQAYSASGKQELAESVLKDVLQEDKMDPQISEALLNIYEKGKDSVSAVQLLTQLIQQTDDQSYYDRLRETIKNMCELPRNYAQGFAHRILLKNGKVLSNGVNNLGQLGSADAEAAANEFADAAFPGNAVRVYATDNTSFVVDAENNLWATGENRWGQLGLAYGDLFVQNGWKKLTDTKDVFCVAGAGGTLMIMKTDGSLWLCGAGVGQRLERWNICDTVLQIQAVRNELYVLTATCELYRGSWSDNEREWTLLDRDVSSFCAHPDDLFWSNTDGSVCFYSGIYAPGDWDYNNVGDSVPDFSVRAVASNGSSAFFLTQDGRLMQFCNSNVSKVDTSSPVVHLYTADHSAVAILEDGTVLLWAIYEDQYVTLS